MYIEAVLIGIIIFIALVSNGSISINSDTGKGTEVIIIIPMYKK